MSQPTKQAAHHNTYQGTTTVELVGFKMRP